MILIAMYTNLLRRRWQKNRGGFLLVTTLSGMSVLSILALGATLVTVQDSQAVRRHAAQLKAYYLAEGGVDEFVAKINTGQLPDAEGNGEAAQPVSCAHYPQYPPEVGTITNITEQRFGTLRQFTFTAETNPQATGGFAGVKTIAAYVRDKVPDDYYDYLTYGTSTVRFDVDVLEGSSALKGNVKVEAFDPEGYATGMDPGDLLQDPTLDPNRSPGTLVDEVTLPSLLTLLSNPLGGSVVFVGQPFPMEQDLFPQLSRRWLRDYSIRRGYYLGPDRPCDSGETLEDCDNRKVWILDNPDNPDDLLYTPKAHVIQQRMIEEGSYDTNPYGNDPGTPTIIFVEPPEQAARIKLLLNFNAFKVVISVNNVFTGVRDDDGNLYTPQGFAEQQRVEFPGGFIVTDKPVILEGSGNYGIALYTTASVRVDEEDIPNDDPLDFYDDDERPDYLEAHSAVVVKGPGSLQNIPLLLDGGIWTAGDLLVETNAVLTFNRNYLRAIKALNIPAEPQVLAQGGGGEPPVPSINACQ